MRVVAWPLVAIAVLGGCVRDPDPTSGLSGSASASGSASTATGEAGSSESDGSGTSAATASASGVTVADTTTDAPATSDDPATGDSGASSDDAMTSDATTGADDAGAASSSTGEPDDLADGILDVMITAHDDCTFTVVPSMIAVPEGTEFTVNWISSPASDIEFDIAKIDQFNAVPIILGMEPGTSYHDDIREWCGDLFTGTFDFELRSCFDPTYIPVDCSAR